MNQEIKDTIIGAVQKEIINENEEVISELLNLLKNKGFVDVSKLGSCPSATGHP
jgi:hypothetical protein